MEHSVIAEEVKKRAMSPKEMASHIKKEAEEGMAYAEENMMRNKAMIAGAKVLMTKEGKAHVADLKEKTQRKLRT